MPVVDPSTYQVPRGWSGAHRQTLYPTLVRRVPSPWQSRERLNLPDGDFLDVDWVENGSAHQGRIAVLLHGLESSTDAIYMRGMARAFRHHGWSVAGLNFRGCSGEPNRLYRSYHSGETDDLATVVEHLVRARSPKCVVLIGFSLGGNVVLKYLGENTTRLPDPVRAAAVLSVPCDLKSCAHRLAEWRNRIYMHRFAAQMHEKAKRKAHLFPSPQQLQRFLGSSTFRDLDEIYTAPAHGFAGAEDYWRQCSSRFYLDAIRCPTLMIQADDDPFLTPACYPGETAASHDFLHLEVTRSGGHLGFVSRGRSDLYWHERRILEFLLRHANGS